MKLTVKGRRSRRIDSGEMAARGEPLAGSAWHLPLLLPSFMVTLPILEQDRALELSQRTAELVEETSWSDRS
jgi:hypothetical protein